jgi:hypothetical protein
MHYFAFRFPSHNCIHRQPPRAKRRTSQLSEVTRALLLLKLISFPENSVMQRLLAVPDRAEGLRGLTQLRLHGLTGGSKGPVLSGEQSGIEMAIIEQSVVEHTFGNQLAGFGRNWSDWGQGTDRRVHHLGVVVGHSGHRYLFLYS